MEGSGERGNPQTTEQNGPRLQLSQRSCLQMVKVRTKGRETARQGGTRGHWEGHPSDGQSDGNQRDRGPGWARPSSVGPWDRPLAQGWGLVLQAAGAMLTILSRALGIWAAWSRSSLYSSSSQSLCSVLRGSLSSTGMATLDRSLPMLFRRMFHKLMLLELGQGAGKQVLLWDLASPPRSRTGPEREISLVAF